MKNRDIHQGLEHAHVRDFLAKSFIDAYKEGITDNTPIEFTGDSFQNALSYAQKDLKNAERRVNSIRMGMAVRELMKNEGWSEFDVSDETQKHPDDQLSWGFIGTEEEYGQFLAKISG